MHRSVLKGAPYNPRTISDDARAKLKRNLKNVGLLEPLIWNKTTGTLLGGHQRLACLDALEGSSDYLLDVSVVELTPAQEAEQNIALNSPNLQGDYDMDMLAQLLKTPELELDATGFDVADVNVLFDDPELAKLFAVNDATETVLSEVEQQAKAAKEAARKQKTADRREMLKREGGKSTDDTECYAVAIFKTREEREEFVQRLGYEADDRYIDGARLRDRLEDAAGRSATAPNGSAVPASNPKPPRPSKPARPS